MGNIVQWHKYTEDGVEYLKLNLSDGTRIVVKKLFDTYDDVEIVGNMIPPLGFTCEKCSTYTLGYSKAKTLICNRCMMLNKDLGDNTVLSSGEKVNGFTCGNCEKDFIGECKWFRTFDLAPICDVCNEQPGFFQNLLCSERNGDPVAGICRNLIGILSTIGYLFWVVTK